jgi:hypothetical protein
MKEDVVPPGATARFRFRITKPAGMPPASDARLYATPVIDGWSWFTSIGMFAPIAVG